MTLKIVLSGMYYPMAILRYFEQALLRRSDVELFRAGPFSGNEIPWDGGKRLPIKYATDIELQLPFYTPIPSTFLQKQLPFEPDLWLTIDAGWNYSNKPTAGKHFVVGTDPHCLNYDKARQVADVFFCMQTPYSKPSDVWLPYAYDPIWHRPAPREHVEVDAGLVGAPYPDRVNWINALRTSGISVNFPGYGPIFEEAYQIYKVCKLGLNWSSLDDLCARVFEVMAMGLCPVVNRVTDLAKMGFVEGEHYYGFGNLSEAVSQVKRALNEDWETVGKSAQQFVTQSPNTWDDRVTTILSYV